MEEHPRVMLSAQGVWSQNVQHCQKKLSLENIDSALAPEKMVCISISFFLFKGMEKTTLSI